MMREECIPFLYDHHAHVSGFSAYLDFPDLSNVRSKDVAIYQIKKKCAKKELNVVEGWNDSYYSLSQTDLRKLPPVIIWNVSGHGILFNKKAEELLEKKFRDEELIENLDSPEWVEKNLLKITKLMIEIGGIDENKIKNTYRYLTERGIYKVEDMLVNSQETINIIKDLGLDERTDFWADLNTFKELSDEIRDEIKGIKLFVDGAIGTKTAYLKKGYNEGGHGTLTREKDDLIRVLKEICKKKAAVHAIGDGAIEVVVGSLETLLEKGYEIPSVRIEHAQFINEKIAKKAKEIGITLCMQPNFSVDSNNYSDRLSEKYLKMNNPFRMLIDDIGFKPGEDLIFGSDGMPYRAEAALKYSLFPPYESQKLTLDEFIEGYCISGKDPGHIEVEIDEEEEEISVSPVR